MKKELNRFEKIADGAYFAIDTRVFESTITAYDPMLANQSILVSDDKSDWYEKENKRQDHPELLHA